MHRLQKRQVSARKQQHLLLRHLDTVAEELKKGEKIQLVGFGTFEIRERSEKQARNPRTGETMTVPASKVPAFKAGKALKDAVK